MSGVTSSEQSTANPTAVNGLVNMISALDNSKPMRVGENSHTEYDWNENKNDYQEQLLQIFFQSVRSDFVTRYNLAMRFKKWVSSIFLKAYENDISTAERNEILELAMYGYKMIAQLRDVEEGKGECRLAYDMLYAWYEGINAIIPMVHTSYTTSIINMNNLVTGMLAMEFMHVHNKKIQYGSFKDYKYICHEFALLHLADLSNPTDVYNKYIKPISLSIYLDR